MTQTTAVATRDPKPALVTGGDVAAIIPRSIEEMFRLAGAISASGMAPSTLNSPDKVMVAIMAGAELGLAPFQSLQSFAVINNRPTIWGDGLMAVVRSQGFKVREWTEGEGDGMIARCEVTRPDTGEVVPGEFSVADAKKANLWAKAGPWQQYPKRMLKMRARAFALRDGAADVLRGFQIREEVEDFQPIEAAKPQATGMRARLEARGQAVGGFDAEHVSSALDEALGGDDLPPHDAETGEVAEVHEDAVIDEAAAEDLPVRDDTFPGDKPLTATAADGFDVLAWSDKLEGDLSGYAGVDPLREDWSAHKAALQAADPDRFKDLNQKVAARAQAIGEGAAQ